MFVTVMLDMLAIGITCRCLFTLTFAYAIGAAKDWGLPGAPYLLASTLLAVGIAVALWVTREV